MTENKIAGLLLAAGGSSRLGRPKQLVEFEGKTLIRRAAEALIEADCSPVIVILGAEVKRSKIELKDLAVTSLENPEWSHGMGSSIGCGMRALLELTDGLDGVLISTCDQPKITAANLGKFLARFAQSPAPIVAAEYDGVLGVPALFAAEMFNALRELAGDKGARDLIRANRFTQSINLPEAAHDVDTVRDLQDLKVT